MSLLLLLFFIVLMSSVLLVARLFFETVCSLVCTLVLAAKTIYCLARLLCTWGRLVYRGVRFLQNL
ncbi:hypothetical protein BD560DRAFT_391088, partial [Blakeslea trispora]